MIRVPTREFLRQLIFPCSLYIVLFFGGSEVVEHLLKDRVTEPTIHLLHFVRGVLSVIFVAVIVAYSLSRATLNFKRRMESICSLLNAANEGLIAFDSVGNVVSLNARATQLLGNLQSPDFQEWAGRLRKQLGERKELETVSPAGDLRLRVVALQSQDSGSLLLLQDITTTKRMEEQWLITEKMASVGRMAAGLAHEIGTPLNIISGRAELIQSAQQAVCGICSLQPDCAVEKHTRVIFQQIERISHIIHQLLAQARQTSLRKESFSLNQCVQKVTEFMQLEMKKKNISLLLKLQPEVVPVFGFADQFQQVVINLLTNAMDAVNGTANIEVATSMDDNQVVLEVADNGSGIPESNLTKIFDPFFTTKEFGKGTGLGLTVTANIVHSHGGTIEVKSKEGNGTRVLIRLPVTPAEGQNRSDAVS